jgi:hypothetical protein
MNLSLGRWHDMASGSGFLIIASDDYDALAARVTNWANFGYGKIIPVLNDDQARHVLTEKFGRSVQN